MCYHISGVSGERVAPAGGPRTSVPAFLSLGPTLPNRLVPDKAKIGIADFG